MRTPPFTRRTFLQQTVCAAAASLAGNGWLRGEEPASVESGLPKLESVSLKESMNRAGDCCLAWLDPQHEYFPTGGYEIAHDTGRWWDALLRLESATGFVIPTRLEEAMLHNVRCLMENPDGLLINDASLNDIQGRKAVINPHNFREGMLSLTALVRFRKSAWARKTGHRLLESIDRCFQPNGRLDYTRLACWDRFPLSDDPSFAQPPGALWLDGTATSGRALEAIIGFHEATGDDLALRLAERIARHHLANTVNPDGSMRAEIINPNNVGHNHSYLGTLWGLFLFGMFTQQRQYVDAVAATYRKTLWTHNISESGWSPHDLGKIRFPNAEGEPVGEHASCADVAQLALWLALRDGHTELLDDVERLIRARLLPAQIVDKSNPRRHGAWGAYAHPFGQASTFDIIAHVLHVLSDIQQHIVTCNANKIVSINLHFDIDTPSVAVQVTRTERGRLRVTPRQSQQLRIRVPSWAPLDTLRLAVADKPLPRHWDKHYLLVSPLDLPVGATVQLDYDLPQRQTVEVMPVTRRQFRLTWRGDEVVACDPMVPIYPALKRQET